MESAHDPAENCKFTLTNDVCSECSGWWVLGGVGFKSLGCSIDF